MRSLLAFLQTYELLLYSLVAIGVLLHLRRLAIVRGELRKTIFGLELETLRARQARSLTMIAVLLLAGLVAFVGANYALPEWDRTQLLHQTASTQGVPMGTPTAMVVFGVDLSGCTDPHATITSPTPGQAVQGKVEIRGSADITQFAFYKYELSNPEASDVWVTLAAGNKPVSDGLLGEWDSTTVPPGVYHLRLVVTDASGQSPKPCIIPLQVLASAP